MRTAWRKSVVAIALACSANLAHAEALEVCSGLRASIGAVIGGALGTLVFPGIGTVWGAALGAGGTCTAEYATRKLA